MITRSGADYAYIMVTFGPLLAFVRIWIECMIGNTKNQELSTNFVKISTIWRGPLSARQ